MIAGFIFLRLRGILGKRTGFEGKQAPQFKEIVKKINTGKAKRFNESFDKEAQNEFLKGAKIAYEVISGASIAIGAIFLIIPGFATDIVGFFLIFPISRKIILSKLGKKYKNSNKQKNNFIEGEFEDIEEDNDKKI